MLDSLILVTAAFFAGLVNTIAGGGTFLTFPALVYTGVPLVAANATSAVAVFPGYLAGAVGFYREIATLERGKLVKIVGLTAIGGLIGSLLLLVSSEKAFAAIVPFLLFFATLAFAFGGRIQKFARRNGPSETSHSFGMIPVAIYGGYFNGGLGIVLLALFSVWGMRDLGAMNGLKNVLSFILSLISVVTFAVAGIVAWPQALMMMVAATVGGYLGAPIARMLPAAVVRGIVIFMGATLSIVFFWRLVS